MWVNVGVEVVVVRRLHRGAVVPGMSVFVAGPTLRCRVCGAAACRVLPSLGARRRAPILGHAGGGVHFPGPFGTRPGRVFGVCVGWLWADLSDIWAGVLVQTNSVRDGLQRTTLLLAGAAHTRAVMCTITAHLCDCERGCGRMCRVSITAQIAAALSASIRPSLGCVFHEKNPLSNIRQLFANFSRRAYSFRKITSSSQDHHGAAARHVLLG